MNRKYKKLVLIAVVCVLGILAEVWVWRGKIGQEEERPPEDLAQERADIQEQWREASDTPLGKYPETVTYTLGKIAGANNANLPVGDTYEDNAYTRYLKNVLNIQNENLFALEANGSYEEALEWTREMVKSDVPVVVFPEGTRSGCREMNQFHGTFFRIAKELGCRLVPVAITGNEHCPDRSFRMSRGVVRVCLLPEIDPRIVRETPPFQLKNLVRRILMDQTQKMDAAG